MQVYRPREGTYVFRDKYFGRALTPDTLLETLRAFFHDGQAPLIQTITAFITRLEAFRNAVNRTPGYRFWSSSLLLVYGGFEHREEEQQESKLQQQEPEDSSRRRQRDPAEQPASKRLKSGNDKKSDLAAGVPSGGDSGTAQPSAIDVRIIDFAHACKVDDPTPDAGMLFGFDNLIKMLRQLLEQSQDNSLYHGEVPNIKVEQETKLSRQLAAEADPKSSKAETQ